MPYAFPSSQTSLISKRLWTVTGYLLCTKPNPPSLRVIGDLRAMPHELISEELETIMIDVYELFEKDSPARCFDLSVSKSIRCVPIRPDTKEEVKQPVFYPDRLLGYNISSNPGLIHVLRAVSDETKDRSYYRVLVLDCNVFLRAMKVNMTILSYLQLNRAH
jgi:hypothetical protein